MAKCFFVVTVLFIVFVQQAAAQNSVLKIPHLSGNVNDWESLLTDAEKSQLDSTCTMFVFKTNIPVSVITFGSNNTTKENANDFAQQADSVLFQYGNGLHVAIFLSKEFRVLSFKANTPVQNDTASLANWKTSIQKAFTASVQPHIGLLKQGKYADGLILILSDLSGAVKKDF